MFLNHFVLLLYDVFLYFCSCIQCSNIKRAYHNGGKRDPRWNSFQCYYMYKRGQFLALASRTFIGFRPV